MTRRYLSVLLLAASLAVPSSFAKTEDAEKADKNEKKEETSKVGRGVNFYSLEKEIALGKQLAQEVERQAKIVDDPIISEYVNRIGQNIVRNSDAKVPFTIKVIDSDEVNAFALPGGFFFVNTGLILKAGNEAELAGVMAHEIAHVAARHATRQATRGEIINYASIPLIFMGGWTGYAVRQAAGLAVPMGFLKFTRGFEAEADRLGLQYMYNSGYDPTAFVDFFEKIQSLEKKKPGTISKVFSTHPMTDDRIKSAQKGIQELQAKPEYVITTSEFNEMHARVERLQSHHKQTDTDPNRPTLKRAPGNGKVDADGDGKQKGDEDERPTLKRRD
jgi:predicted Zn-dependent protease